MKVLALLIALLIIPIPAFAYLDPASGSAIISAIIGLFVAISLVIKSYWYKFKSLYSEYIKDKTNTNHGGR